MYSYLDISGFTTYTFFPLRYTVFSFPGQTILICFQKYVTCISAFCLLLQIMAEFGCESGLVAQVELSYSGQVQMDTGQEAAFFFGLLASMLSCSRLYLHFLEEYMIECSICSLKGQINLFLQFLYRSHRCQVYLLSRQPVAQRML